MIFIYLQLVYWFMYSLRRNICDYVENGYVHKCVSNVKYFILLWFHIIYLYSINISQIISVVTTHKKEKKLYKVTDVSLLDCDYCISYIFIIELYTNIHMVFSF